MAFHAVRGIPAANPGTVGVDINTAVHPCASPGPVVDIESVGAPVKAAVTPSPRTEECTDGYAESETDGCAHNEPRARRRINNERVVERHADERRVDGRNLDIRTTTHDDLTVATQIAEILGPLAHSLHRIHHVLALGEKGVAEVGGPIHVRGHGVEN